MKKEFIDFLNENNVYDEFKAKIEMKQEVDLEDYLDHTDPEDYLIEGFYWGNGPEFNIWSNINDKWLDTI